MFFSSMQRGKSVEEVGSDKEDTSTFSSPTEDGEIYSKPPSRRSSEHSTLSGITDPGSPLDRNVKEATQLLGSLTIENTENSDYSDDEINANESDKSESETNVDEQNYTYDSFTDDDTD